MMKTIRKPCLMLFFASWIILAFFMLHLTAMPVHAEDTGETVMTNVRYIDRSSGDDEIKYCPEAIAMSTVSGNTIGNGKWYVVDEIITRNSRLRITGECNLILSSHGKLECSKGISVNRGNTLNVYSDYYDDSGWLYCELSSEDGDAAIGGDEEKNGGTINIHGGSIYAEAKCYGAGIGGGEKGSGGYVYIDGGKVAATGGKINVKFFDVLQYENYGQGWGRENSDWNILASLIFALFKSGEYGGAGIGGGHSGSGADVVIMGGEVIANAGCPSACAIGGGKGKQGGSLRLYDKACVMVTSDTSDVNSLTRVLSEQRIPSTRTYPLVHILPCIHPDGYSYS